MKNKKNNLDERQEQIMLQIEHTLMTSWRHSLQSQT